MGACEQEVRARAYGLAEFPRMFWVPDLGIPFCHPSNGICVSQPLAPAPSNDGHDRRHRNFSSVCIVSQSSCLVHLEVEEENVTWAIAGTNATLQLISIDPVQVAVGTVLCPLSSPVTLATNFTARIVVFDIEIPITAGASVRHC